MIAVKIDTISKQSLLEDSLSFVSIWFKLVVTAQPVGIIVISKQNFLSTVWNVCCNNFATWAYSRYHNKFRYSCLINNDFRTESFKLFSIVETMYLAIVTEKE